MSFTGETAIPRNFLYPYAREKVSGNSCLSREASQLVCAGPTCSTPIEQPATGRRRRYCSQRCKQAFYREEFRNATDPPARAPLGPMMVELRYYGGHLERDGSSTIDGCRQDERIDVVLYRILGGVPRPSVPRSPVLELPVAREIPNTETVAA